MLKAPLGIAKNLSRTKEYGSSRIRFIHSRYFLAYTLEKGTKETSRYENMLLDLSLNYVYGVLNAIIQNAKILGHPISSFRFSSGYICQDCLHIFQFHEKM